MPIKYLSLFSGIEAASLAWEPLGWEPMAFCEVDEFPAAVLAHRWPDVPNLGDITKVDWGEFIERSGRPDVVVGGSPCQSFSIAGGRASLDGESRLMYEYIRACDEVRSEWIVWENVPGALNTRDNAFGQLIRSLQDVGYVSLAWRVLDAQFVRVAERDSDGRVTGWFGPVAQRRRRVFLVGHLGSGGSAPAVLFESESVCGNNQTSKQKREELTANARRGADCGDSEGGMTAFKYSAGSAARTMPTYDDGSVNTLTADWHSPAVAFAQNTREEVRLIGGSGDHVGALAVNPDSKGQGRSLICEPVIRANCHVNSEYGVNVSTTILARSHKDPPILIDRAAFNQGENAKYDPYIKAIDVAPPLVARGPHAVAMSESGD